MFPFKSVIVATVALGYLTGAVATAKDISPSTLGQNRGGDQISSDKLLELGTPSSESLRLEGEQAMRYGDYDKAIAVLEKSVKISPSNMDGRILYAEALEKKLLKQQSKDPILYNFALKQWFVVFKNGDYMDQKMQGRSHLMSLSGTVPKHFESDNKFLSRVLLPEDGSVKVALSGNRKIAATETDQVK